MKFYDLEANLLYEKTPGARSFNHKSLHHIANTKNPYEQAISIIGKTLSAFDEDNLIPCFGFGDGKESTNCFLLVQKDV